jgi:hypothetical protein
MKAMSVGELETHFSGKEPVAMIVPYVGGKMTERKIGILDGKVTIDFKDDFEMTAEELCNL